MANCAFIALGTNIGERYDNIEKAIFALKENEHIQLISASSIYETDPVGYVEQDPFLNMVIEVKTSYSSFELLHFCMEVEQVLGRKREIRWGPRIIDLDILLYNQENIETEQLIIPHPRMQERAFVLVPLLEICPTLLMPETKRSLKGYLNNLADREGVRVWKLKNGEDVFALFAN